MEQYLRAGFFLSLVTAAWASDPVLRREGDYFTAALAGSAEMAPHAKLSIQSPGPVRVHGENRKHLAYTLEVEVKARSEREARDLLRSFEVKVTSAGDNVTVSMRRGAGTTRLKLQVPRSVRAVNVSSSGGALEIAGVEGRVSASTGGGPVRADRIKGDVTLNTAGGEIRIGSIHGSVRCATAGGAVSAQAIQGEAVLETGGGDITAGEIGAGVRATTAAGAIRIERAGGPVVVSTGGGSIDVGRAAGMVTVRNSVGPVRVGAAHGVRCESGSGGVHLNNVSGSLRVSTAFGNIMAQFLSGQPLAESFLTTGSGDIVVVIPSNLGVTIRAENDLADNIRRIISEFPDVAVRLRGGHVIAEGAINSGGPLLRISGTGGTIFIKRQP
jgi:DUF4097 and DUF4098 domain-containing protein YvlB